MPVNIILGLQWGDEGKGKIVDLMSENADYVVRYHGGNNAGHTVVLGDKKFFFRLIPSGIFHTRPCGIIANGTVVDLDVLTNEINILEAEGINLTDKLVISPRCHLILPYHKELDAAYEKARGKEGLGTTKRGIGPAYADKVSYNGIRMYELLDWKLFTEKFTFQAKIKNKILKTFNIKPLNITKELEKIKKLRGKIIKFVKDAYCITQTAIDEEKNILLEGAHGIMLDTDWSPYPFSTASNTIVGEANIGAGVPFNSIKRIIGIVKAFTSRVGGGPLPTELNNASSKAIREKGAEYGTTTGRPRRIGWLDLEAVKFSCRINSVTEIVITKLDILSGLKEIKICTGYKLKDAVVPYSSCGYKELAKVKPIYKTFAGWEEDISYIRNYNDLPAKCKEYLKFISEFLNVKISIASVGAERNANVYMN
ncbi:MAG: adenylosuccinate synthase [Ignavibacteriae bacterium]|nr:MAG: adenylosuccinate synthase [Ignavibacteriota bacterium]